MELDDILYSRITNYVFHFEGSSYTEQTTDLWQYLLEHITEEKEKHATRAKIVEMDVLNRLTELVKRLEGRRYRLMEEFMKEQEYQTQRKGFSEVNSEMDGLEC